MQWLSKHRRNWIFLATVLVTPYANAQAMGGSNISTYIASPSDSCMTKLWKGLLPLVAKDHSYISMADVERVAGVRMQHVVQVAPMDSIGSYEMHRPVLLHSYDPWALSFRDEIQDQPSPAKSNSFDSSWQVAQGLATGGRGSTSVLDIACSGMGALTLAKVEADLQMAGFKVVAKSTMPLQQHVEIFANQWGDQIHVYYEMPVEVAPGVTSLHIVGRNVH